MYYACIHLPDPPPGAAPGLQTCALGFAPEWELLPPGTILFDVGRLNRLYGSPVDIARAIQHHAASTKLEANIAIAPNIDTALLAARNFPGVTVIPEDASGALSDLYIEALPISPALWDTLDAWGIRTVRDLAQLPEAGIAERLGTEGVRLRQLARGAVERPLRVFKPEVAFEGRAVLEHGLSELQPLLFVLSSILNEQCAKLESHGLSTNTLVLTLDLENGTEHRRELRLPLPLRLAPPILKLLQLDLEAHPPKAAVTSLRLVLKPTQPRTTQNGIFLPPTPAPDKLEITMARIRALVGEGNVGVAELLNTHRPAPFRLVAQQPAVNQKTPAGTLPPPKLAYRYFQPAIPVHVELSRNQPIRLISRIIRGDITTCAGPWRGSGDWWTEDPWSRDEWDVSLTDGAIYRIYRNQDDSWFIEGTYD